MRPQTPLGDDGLELSIVIPCLNEEKAIGHCVSQALAAIRRMGVSGEVVVSDNGSTDRSVAIAAERGARIVHCPLRGYGAALQGGFLAARGRYILMGDSDGSHDFDEAPLLVEPLRRGAVFVTGTRLRGHILPRPIPWMNRYIGTPLLTRTLNWLFGTRITDCNCGMRAIRRDTYVSLGMRATGMEFASEMIVRAALRNVPIVEVPITMHKELRERPPHLRRWRDGWRHLRLFLRHAPAQTMTKPGLLLAAVGLALAALNVNVHYTILGLTLTLIGLAAITCGVAIAAHMPDEDVLHSRLMERVHGWFTFE